MKRSRVNAIMTQADDMIRSFGFTLPPFAYWTPQEFRANKERAGPIIVAQCGWDITDYGVGDSATEKVLPSDRLLGVDARNIG